MYDDLISSLRICGRINSANDNCIAFHDGSCEAEPVCMYELMGKAADAIEELSKQHEAQRENIVVLMDIIENDRNEIEWLKKCLNDLPKPVRCRDCIHLSGVTNGGTFFRCDRYDRWQDESNRVYMPLDGFCSYGQKEVKSNDS